MLATDVLTCWIHRRFVTLFPVAPQYTKCRMMIRQKIDKHMS
jgi:hypothetical protein